MDIALDVRSPSGTEHSVTCTLDETCTGAEMISAIAGLIGMPSATTAWNERTRRRVEADRTIATADIRTGDALHLGDDGWAPAWAERDPTILVHRFELVVVGGADAGRRVPLRRGEVIVGRDEASDLHLADADVSRRHLHLSIGDSEVHATDLGSTNGTDIDSRPAEGTVILRPGQILAVGNTLLTVRDIGAAPRASANVSIRDGHVDFSRPPRVNRPPTHAVLHLPDVPIKPPGRRIPMSAAIGPVVMGAVMAVAIGPQMLLFALMGPVMLLFTTWEDRRGGHALYRSACDVFERQYAEFATSAPDLHRSVMEARRIASPDPGDVVGRVLAKRANLWERRTSDDDFLVTRVGLTDAPTALRFDGTLPAMGDAELTARVESVLTAHRVDPDVPLTVDIARHGVVGVTGPTDHRAPLLRWIVLQAALLHSPRDLALAIVCSDAAAGEWAWTRWLPHARELPGLRSDRRPIGSGRNAGIVVNDLLVLVDARVHTVQRSGGMDRPSFVPVLVLIADTDDLAGDDLDRLLATGPSVGVFCIVTAAHREHLPGRSRCLVEFDVRGRVTVTDTATGVAGTDAIPDGVSVATCEIAARAVAPFRDVTASDDGGVVPERCLLLDVLDLGTPSPTAVLERWARHGLGEDLGAPVGIGGRGVIHIDLRRDGPHGLTAGTTGAGKSEFLQSFVGSLAATYPPNRLTFVLVDYKGGAAFKDCVDLPHTVGFFTDLDSHLAQRALISLNAELRYREEVLREHGAKDLIDLERSAPAAAPPNLLIVFDEFAFLKREVPEFVAGVIDIAQRGRSLGVHLMLATQRPSGVVDDNIRANTNLRVALRMADEGDSMDVIDRPDAAHIQRSLPGRAYLRVGHGDVRPVQTAYANARSSGTSGPSVTVRPLVFAPTGDAATGPVVRHDGPSDLQRIVESIGAAWTQLDGAVMRPPWLPALGDRQDLADLARTAVAPAGSSELTALLGTADQPSAQRQVPWFLDLGATGHCLVFGTAGAGKTTLLRSLAVGLSLRLGPADLHVYGIDMAGRGLASLEQLPTCGGVAAADEPERIERLFALLEREVSERSNRMAGAGSLQEYRAQGGRLPYVVVLLDGFAAFSAAYSVIDGGALVEQLVRLIAMGRTVGVHFVMSADRRNSVSSSVSASVSSRVVMRLADPDEYSSFGLGMSLADATLPAGRAFADGGEEVQVAVCGPDPSGPGQAATIARWATVLRQRAADQPVPVPVMLPPFSSADTV